jgi:hypothetical protein
LATCDKGTQSEAYQGTKLLVSLQQLSAPHRTHLRGVEPSMLAMQILQYIYLHQQRQMKSNYNNDRAKRHPSIETLTFPHQHCQTTLHATRVAAWTPFDIQLSADEKQMSGREQTCLDPGRPRPLKLGISCQSTMEQEVGILPVNPFDESLEHLLTV